MNIEASQGMREDAIGPQTFDDVIFQITLPVYGGGSFVSTYVIHFAVNAMFTL